MSIKVFYNEIDPFCCAWLSNLMDAGQIRPGTISDKSIADLSPDEVRNYEVAHFFAGIGGWDYALTLAGWNFDGRRLWTGSCPCQPFSAAGKQQGQKDDRHLWPEFFRLIRECRPDTVFGEQVANAIGHDWLDHVSADLEGEGYAVGSIVLGAHSVGAPHIRQRLWFVADSQSERCGEARPSSGRSAQRFGDDCKAGELAESNGIASRQGRALDGWRNPRGDEESRAGLGGGEHVGVALGDTNRSKGSRFRQVIIPLESEQEASRSREPNPWENVEFIGCADGKARPTQPGLQPLAHGVSARVGRLRGYGNAIVPQVAAEVIRAYLAND